MKMKMLFVMIVLRMSTTAMADATQEEIHAVVKAASARLTSFSEIRFTGNQMCAADRSCKEYQVTGRDENGSELQLTVSSVRLLTRQGEVKATID